jgi:hypothetical protein
LDGLTIIEWLQTDQQFLFHAHAAVEGFRQGQQARRAADQKKAAM